MIMKSYRTQSLFHYTHRLDTIVRILECGCLYPNFCCEDLSTSCNNIEIGIPQICFCDIPISMAKNFIDNYGKYAIGFSKLWGIKNGCNPVQYVNNECIIDGIIFYHKMWKEYELTFQNNRTYFN